MNPADLAVIAATITSVTQTVAFLIGLRTVVRQLRIAAPPKEQQQGATEAQSEREKLRKLSA